MIKTSADKYKIVIKTIICYFFLICSNADKLNALQRMQQALAKAEREVEQMRTRDADINADTITTTTNYSNK